MGKLIVVSSGKGGVGKTTTCVNLASTLAHRGLNVVLVDGNLTTPNVGLHLGLTKFPITFNDVLKGNASLEDAIYVHPLGFKILPGSLSMRSFSEVNSRHLKMSLIELRDMFDIVLVDSAAGLGNEAMSIIKQADELLIVTNPELPAITDAFKIINHAKEIGIPVKGVVLNKVQTRGHDLGNQAIESLLETPISIEIDHHHDMRQALYKKTPFVHMKPKHHVTKKYHSLAHKVHTGEYQRRIEELEAENTFLRSILNTLGFGSK
ncbi:MAG: cell division ATPase MinD [Candidatus Woesearchaeota archaeon]